MSSNAFKKALAATKGSKNVETILVGTSYLDEGTHDVTIQAVDVKDLEEMGRIKVTYLGEGGKGYSNNLFMMNADGTEFGFSLRQFWSALIPDKDALGTFIDLADADNKAFEMFTGMKLRITIKAGKGVQARASGAGFAGYDVESNDQVTAEYENIKDVYNEIKARALKRSYLQVSRFECSDKEANLAAFAAAVAGVTSSKFTAGDDIPL